MYEDNNINIPIKGYKVRIYREDFNFSAGHISIFQNDLETLHGHNYRVSVGLSGKLDDDFILIDFRYIKKLLKNICNNLNHRILVPVLNSKIVITERDSIAKIATTLNNTQFELPANNILCLQLPNISSEMLAYYIFNEIKKDLRDEERIEKLLVEIEESNGQSVIFEG